MNNSAYPRTLWDELRREPGAIWARTPGQLCGYWNDEAETAGVLVDGWVRTRDLGHLGDNDFVCWTGRARDPAGAAAAMTTPADNIDT